MVRHPKRNPDAAPVVKKGMILAAAAVWIGLGGCDLYRQPDVLDEKKINAVVTEVMEDQSAPIAKESVLNTMGTQQGSLFDDSGEKSELKAKTMHQLADLYRKFEEQMYRQELFRYNQQLNLIQQGRSVQKPAPPRIDHARSRKIYEKLLTLYPNRPENDLVLYQLAHVYEDEGDTEQEMAVLRRMADHYPPSPLSLEAVFRLAETYYDSNQYRQAAEAYQKVINSKDPDLIERALYKLGWSYFSLQEYERAAGIFTRLVDRKRVARGSNPPRLDPRSMSATEWDQIMEIIRGLAFAFSYLGPPTKIQDYFEKAGHRDYEDLIYRKQGDLYMAQKRVQDAVGAYETFIKTYPFHEEAPMVQMDIIEAYQRLKLVDLANRARISFVERFGDESVWYQKATPPSRNRARPMTRQLISQMALFYHSEAQQTRRAPDYERALTWYRRYLKSFPKEPEAARINFLSAEGLFELRRYPEAVAEYERTAYEYPLHQDSAESGYAAIVTLDKIIGQGRQDPTISPTVLKLARNCKRFAEAFPNDSRVMDVLWKGAETYYHAGNFPAARSMAEAIVKASLPTDSPSLKAQRMIGNAYFEEHAYEQAAAAYEQLTQTGGVVGDDEDLRRLWATSLYKRGEEFKAEGNLREAQMEFMKVYLEVPGSEIAPVALFDGGSAALLRNQLDEALQLFQMQLQRYPNHPLSEKVPEVLLQVGRTLLASGKVTEAQDLAEKVKGLQTASKVDLSYRSERLIADHYFEERAYEQAAAVYRKLAQDEISAKNQEREELKRLWASSLYKQAEGLKTAGKQTEAQAGFLKVQAEVPESEIAPVALFDAGNTAQLRDDSEGAFKAFTILLQEYPSSTYGPHAAIQVAKIHERSGRLREAAKGYESVVKLGVDRKTTGEALLAASRLYEQLGDWMKAGAVYQTYLDQYPGEYEQVVETTFKLAWAKLQEGRRQEAQPILQTLIDRYGRGDAAASPAGYYVAKAHLLMADELLIQFDEVKLVSPLEKNLAKKKKLLKEVLEGYAQATEFSVAEVTTAATQKIGVVFEKFRNALLESERPADLTPQQLEQYNFLIEEQAFPFEEKAIAAYESNVHRAQQLGLYDPWIKQSYDDLARLMPARYRKRELDEVIPRELVLTP
ncbi:MAG: tetratricopeptide repeat protein [Nitrospirae bacterium]|nr:tetratricopeptide repeat protein [Nitrospirota bacterium]